MYEQSFNSIVNAYATIVISFFRRTDMGCSGIDEAPRDPGANSNAYNMKNRKHPDREPPRTFPEPATNHVQLGADRDPGATVSVKYLHFEPEALSNLLRPYVNIDNWSYGSTAPTRTR